MADLNGTYNRVVLWLQIRNHYDQVPVVDLQPSRAFDIKHLTIEVLHESDWRPPESLQIAMQQPICSNVSLSIIVLAQYYPVELGSRPFSARMQNFALVLAVCDVHNPFVTTWKIAYHLTALEQLEGFTDVGLRVAVEVHTEGDDAPPQVKPLPHILGVCKSRRTQRSHPHMCSTCPANLVILRNLQGKQFWDVK